MESFISEISRMISEFKIDEMSTALKIFITFVTAVSLFWKLPSKIIQIYHQRKINDELSKYYPLDAVKQHVKMFIPAKYQLLPPTEFDNSDQKNKNLIQHLIKNCFKLDLPENKFHMVLAGSGMGKTTFMINLYHQYNCLLFGKHYRIELLPLAHPQLDKILENIKDPEQTILLLDAFDEDSNALVDYENRLKVLLYQVRHFKKVVITCRTQFFPSLTQEPSDTQLPIYMGVGGFHSFNKYYISYFDEQDINKYLRKKFSSIFSISKKRRAQKIVMSSSNLMSRPMILSFIEDLLSEPTKVFHYSFQIYEVITDSWIQREASKPMYDSEDKRGLFALQLKAFSARLSLYFYDCIKQGHGAYSTVENIAKLAQEFEINISELELRNRSLLYRNAADLYQFAHRSIFEYFLAVEVFFDKDLDASFNFDDFEQVKQFYVEMLWHEYMLPFINLYRVEGRYCVEPEQWKSIDYLQMGELFTITGLHLEHFDLLKLNLLRGLKSLKQLKLSKLEIPSNQLNDLVYKGTLNLQRLQINDISILQGIIELRQLNLSGNQIKDISPLAHLQNLTHLDLSSNCVELIKDLEELRSVQELNLNDNQVSNILPIGSLTHLRRLHLKGNRIDIVEPLKHLTDLEELDLRANNVSSLEPISNLVNLNTLMVSSNDISNIDALSNLKELTSLQLQHNQIKTLKPIAALQKLSTLQVQNNCIDTIDTQLTNKSWSNLESLDLSGNQISNFDLILQLDKLQEVNIKDNNPDKGVENLVNSLQDSGVDIKHDLMIFKDKKLEQLVREQGNFEQTALLLKYKSTIKQLECGRFRHYLNTSAQHTSNKEQQLEDLSGIESIPDLMHLRIGRNMLTSLAPLKTFSSLTSLAIGHNKLSDLSPLGFHSNLNWLAVGEGNISDLSALAGLTKLKILQIVDNKIADLKPLAHLKKLATLFLYRNNFTSISSLAGLHDLTHLSISFNQISDISPLSSLVYLEGLNINNIGIDNIEDLAPLKELSTIYMSSNRIRDISVLESLTDLDRIHFSQNKVKDIRSLSYLEEAKEISMSNNLIRDIGALSNLTEMTSIEMSANKIDDISALANLTQLTRVYMGTNRVVDVSPLANLVNLTRLNLNNNRVKDINSLVNLSNLVNIDLSNNSISNIEPLTQIPSLRSVSLVGNPLDAAAKNIIAKLEASGCSVRL